MVIRECYNQRCVCCVLCVAMVKWSCSYKPHVRSRMMAAKQQHRVWFSLCARANSAQRQSVKAASAVQEELGAVRRREAEVRHELGLQLELEALDVKSKRVVADLGTLKERVEALSDKGKQLDDHLRALQTEVTKLDGAAEALQQRIGKQASRRDDQAAHGNPESD